MWLCSSAFGGENKRALVKVWGRFAVGDYLLIIYVAERKSLMVMMDVAGKDVFRRRGIMDAHPEPSPP